MITQENNAIFHASIGDTVRAWREARDLNVTELARRCGSPITKGYLSQLEHNKVRQPSEDHLMRIAAALKIPVLFLVTRRLPSELSHDEQAKLAALQNFDEEEAGFVFDAPIPSSRQGDLNEEEELRQILAQLEELRSRVKKLIAQKGRQR